MRWARAFARTALLALFSAGGAEAQDKAGAFDFYVLALSWSPTFCAAQESSDDSDQCRDGAKLGFIVHGLWPQRERGYPQSCATGEPQRVPRDLAAEMLDIMPDFGLVFSQWRKHGTCTGLSQAEYFKTTRTAAGRVTIPPEFSDIRGNADFSPDDVERVFLAANPGMDADGIAIACDAGLLEVRICVTRELGFRGCEEVNRRGCRQSRVSVPAPG